MSSKAYDRPLEHKEYIRLKYLSQKDDKDPKKKTKKRKLGPNKTKKIRIFDDDIDFKKLGKNGSDDELHYATQEEKPVIAAVIDDRPLHMKRKDIDTNRWRTVESSVPEEEDKNTSKTQIVLEISSTKSRKKKRNQSEGEIDLSSPQNKTQSKHKSEDNKSDSDLSPQRGEQTNSVPKRRRHDSDSDLSPEREDKSNSRGRSRQRSRSRQQSERPEPRIRHDSDSDLSPPRPQTTSDRKTDKKRELTLAGKKAGLSDGKLLRQELLETKKKEQKLFETISDEMLGKNAKTVFRDSKSGRIRNLEEEARVKYEKDLIKDKIDAEKKAKYEKWSKGVVQTQEKHEKRESDLHEMSKPLARYEDDEDLDKILREKEREDDPMLQTIKQNRTKKKMQEEGLIVRPEYKGPPPPINRFAITPGYRWDGVDRSNGFEKKYYDRIAGKEAIQEEAYKWSTQDM